MGELTNKELADIVCGDKPWSISMGKDGCSITSDGTCRSISVDQAEIALHAMGDVIEARSARS